MPLIDCPECKKPVSSEAHACPYCGYPVAEKVGAAAAATPAASASPAAAEPLAEIRASWWGFFWYWFFCWLIIPPFIAWIRRSMMVLRIYPDRITIERGLLSKCYQDYNPRDIRSVDVDQSLFKRLVGIGDLTFSTSATVEASEVLRSIPDPKGVRELIIAQRGGR